MLNPMSKVQSLKIEIDQIKQQIFASVPENPASPSKLSEKDTLIQKLTSVKAQNQQKKDEMTAAVNAIQKKLQSLAQKKQSTHKSRALRGKYQTQVAVYEKELERVNKEYQVFSENYDRLYGVSIDPTLYENGSNSIENQLSQIASKHSSLSETLKSLQQEQERMENTLKMMLEDIISRSAAKAETIMQRENLETQIELIEYEFAEELEYNEPEDDFILKMLKLKKQKDPVLSSLALNKLKTESIDQQIEKTRMKINQCSNEMVKMCLASPGFEELRNVEEAVKEKVKTFKTDPIEKVVLEVSSVEGFNIEEEILRIQLKVMEKEEARLRASWSAQSSELLIIQSNPVLSRDLKPGSFKTTEKIFQLRVASIKAWKYSASSLLSTSSTLEKVVQDSIIMQEFKSQFSSINYKDHKKLESLMTVFLTLLEKREGFLSDLNLARKLAEQDQFNNEIISALSSKPGLLEDRLLLEKQLDSFQQEETRLGESLKVLGLVPSPSKAQLYMLKETIQTWDEKFSAKNDEKSVSAEDFLNYKESLQRVRNEAEGLKASLTSVTNEEFALSSEVEKILERKRAEMLSSLQDLRKTSKNPEEMKLYEMNFKVVEATARVERAAKDLKDFDSNISSIISNIEQEEVSIRKQQIELEQAIKEIEKELGFIGEYEQKLRKLDQWDVASALTIDNCKSPLEEYLGSGFKAPDEGGIIEGNYLEFSQKLLGRGVQVTRNRIVNKKYFRIRLENASQVDRTFYERIMPLLEGAELYKKISDKSRKFDPLADLPPESCGFSLRQIFLHKSLEKIEMKHPMKPGFDLRINTEQLCNPKVSKVTLALLQSQGHEELDFTEGEQVPVFLPAVQQSKGGMFYPFNIVLKSHEQIEVIAKDYITFKQWIQGINALVSNKKKLAKLRTRIETYTSV
jgi:hypothetical protein